MNFVKEKIDRNNVNKKMNLDSKAIKTLFLFTITVLFLVLQLNKPFVALALPELIDSQNVTKKLINTAEGTSSDFFSYIK